MNKFSNRASRLIYALSQDEAAKYGCREVLPEHLMLAILKSEDGLGYLSLKSLQFNLAELKTFLESYVKNFSEHSDKDDFAEIPQSRRMQTVLDLAYIESCALSNPYVGTEHILLGAVRESNSPCAGFFADAKITLGDLRETVKKIQKEFTSSADAKTFKDIATATISDLFGKSAIDEFAEFLNSGTSSAESESEYDFDSDVEEKSDYESENDLPLKNFGKSKADDSFLSEFSRDITKLAKDEKIDPVVGREKEINRIIQILSRRTKNNPCLVGDPGVGKTAIAEGLAYCIAKGNVPEGLLNKRILSFDIAAMVAGTKFRGEFEERMKRMMKELKKDGNIILFIDELHTIIGAGGPEGQMDASNMLKPALSRGEIQIIGATTTKEYTRYIEKDSALERRFQKINVEEPSDEDTVKILEGIKSQYEKFHGIIYDEGVIPLIVKLTRRYIQERFLPDKAIDILDESGAQKKIIEDEKPKDFSLLENEINNLVAKKQNFVKSQDYESAAQVRDEIIALRRKLEVRTEQWKKNGSGIKKHVTTKDICHIIGEMTGIPVEQLDSSETSRLLNMEAEMHKTVIGQKEAVHTISGAIRRNRAGISSPKHPIGSFIFLGPTGVGKTQLAKALAKFMFGSEEHLIRIDMSDFMEKHNASRLVGAPPGYIGYEDGGVLTEQVRRHPYSVVLLDEIEKAHPDVFNLLLQLLEEGELSDNLGHTVNFRNTVVIMTSNAGARQISSENLLGFNTEKNGILSYGTIKNNAMNELKKLLTPELINRIDDVIVFEPLGKKEISQILDIQIAELSGRLSEKRLSVEIKPAAREYLVEKGYEPTFGARPMRRLIQKEIEDPLSTELLACTGEDFNKVSVDFINGELSVNLEKNDYKLTQKVSVEPVKKENILK